MARDEKIMIRLTAETKENFATIAEELGMTVSALGSFVIGSFVRQQNQIVTPLNTAIREQMTLAATKLIEHPEHSVNGKASWELER